jgi:hypothetical protein
MKGIFRDSENEAIFLREGYIKVPFLDEEGLSVFRKHVKSIESYYYDAEYGICTTTDLRNPTLVREVNHFVIDAILPYIAPYFHDYQIILGTYLIKKPQDNTLIPIHQDWTFVDEQQFYSLCIWCPLEDVNPNNGNLQVIPRTQRMSSNLRPSPLFPSAFDPVLDLARKHLIDVPMKAGEAIFFDHALLHASPVNKSGKARVVLTLGLTHKDASLKHHYLLNEATLNQEVELGEFEINEDFFANHIRAAKPAHSKVLQIKKSIFLPVDEKTFKNEYKDQRSLKQKCRAILEKFI